MAERPLDQARARPRDSVPFQPVNTTWHDGRRL